MLENLHLAAILKQGSETRLMQIPLHQGLQIHLSHTFQSQYDAFMEDMHEIDFDAGYRPEANERFRLEGFVLPAWIANETSLTIQDLASIGHDDALVDFINGVVVCARDEHGQELVLFQNFNRGYVIEPGRFLLLQNDVYESSDRPALSLGSGLSAVYVREEGKLLFRNFRNANTFLPLAGFYAEASEADIRQVLENDIFAPEDIDALAVDANQWFRKRFAMLKDSGIIDQYTVDQIATHSEGYEVQIKVEDGKIVFPEDRKEAKRLLQFLNEEIFLGAITDTLYETNSKREAD